ncbi:MAG: hypothetical protein K8F91_19630 [Candidatus Obscuribacterales bacterium]|nr:hypothetical protein [Candidatus Obscuribacterales bacterium]
MALDSVGEQRQEPETTGLTINDIIPSSEISGRTDKASGTAEVSDKSPKTSDSSADGTDGPGVFDLDVEGDAPKSRAQEEFENGRQAFSEMLKELAPKFEGAIRMADEDLVAAQKNITEQMPLLAPKMIQAQEELALHSQNVAEQVGKLPKDQQEEAGRALQEYFSAGDQAGRQAALAKFGDNPLLKAAVKGFGDSLEEHKPTMEKVAELQTGFQTAIADSMRLRLQYGQMLQSTGENQRSKELFMEAQAIMMMYFGPPPQQERPQQRPSGPRILEANMEPFFPPSN